MAATSWTLNAFTQAFDLAVPIVQAPMGGVSGHRLVAAAAEAGALAILPIWFLSPTEAASAIAATRALTNKPFAVNVRADLIQHDLIAAAIENGVSIVHLFWGDSTPSMPAIRRAGGRMIATVSDADTTKAALDAGATALIAQGVEAGGHVFGATPLAELVPLVVDMAADVPVAAAGGLADADDVMRAFELGASAAVLGTRLAATEESEAHAVYKQALIDARAGDTVRSNCFDGMWPDAPHRTLKNSTYCMWDGAGRPRAGARPGEGDIVLRITDAMSLPRYHMAPPSAGMTGDCEAAALYAGMGVGKVADVRQTSVLIAEIMTTLRPRMET